MVSFKVKLKLTSGKKGEGRIYFQLIYDRRVKFYRTGYKLFENEFDRATERVIIPPVTSGRYPYLCDIQHKIDNDIIRIKSYVAYLRIENEGFDIEQFSLWYNTQNRKTDFFAFMRSNIERQRSLGKIRLSEIYTTTLNSFMRFCKARELPIDNINSDMMQAYEVYLRQSVSSNTSSFYMRNLRSIYNRAVDVNIVAQRNPFKHVYTGIERTKKRAVSLDVIRRLKNINLKDFPKMEFARDIFMFSFYTRGMAFVDIAYLRKKDLSCGILTYRRKKTGQKISVRWERCMQEIVDKYTHIRSAYMFPIVEYNALSSLRNNYRNIAGVINTQLKMLSCKMRLQIPITMYVARHAWASIAKSKNVPLSVISEGMGHDSESTTKIYLTSLDTYAVDRANRLILNAL